MARRRRQHPLLKIAQAYLNQHMPEMAGARLQLRNLDGPPEAPRYSVTAECCLQACPHGVAPAIAAVGKCPVADCPLRCSVRLLLSRRGTVLHTTQSTIHWQ
ncbi:MAG: hypothetical protein JST60_13995 [Chloroflexi bacterium SZAS-1]|nr:hypothetical protein [Chloroflexi bacterium SZAS-1]HNP86605.1 hypothetical protein [Kouleothrix sp.]